MPATSLRRRLLLVAVVLVTAAVVLLTPAWHWLSGGLQPLLTPLTARTHGLALWWGNLTAGPRLAAENESLRQQLAASQSQAAEVASLTQENQALKALSNVPGQARFTSQGAEVIGRLQDERGTTYLINRGARDGLVPGLAVVAGTSPTGDGSAQATGLLVGLVRDVVQSSASFSLTTSSSSQVLAEVANSTHSRGVAVGQYNLALQLKFVPLGDNLKEGDQVVTSNLDHLVPTGLLIGTISAVQSQEGDFFTTATVSPPQALERFRFVRVLTPNSP